MSTNVTSVKVVNTNQPNGKEGEAIKAGFTLQEIEWFRKQQQYRKDYTKRRYDRMKLLKSIMLGR